GGAVTVTALTNLVISMNSPGEHHTSPWLWIGIVGMAVCVVIVAYHTPHVAPKKSAPAEPQASATDAKPHAS
ncbi:MAG TPA: hypothetical protein VK137_20555, partial [Planctomycetaceae bacterium]|nr:hypothetical protein [Planctomycetaceae bacterium]